MKTRTFYEQNRNKYIDIIAANGGDLEKFLKSYKFKIIRNYLKKKKKRVKEKKYGILSNRGLKKLISKDTYIKYKLMCISEEINEKVLLDSFMNYFCEGDYELPSFLQKLDNYNNSSILHTKRAERREKRKQKALMLIKKQNVDREWVQKYTNINIDEVDF